MCVCMQWLSVLCVLSTDEWAAALCCFLLFVAVLFVRTLLLSRSVGSNMMSQHTHSPPTLLWTTDLLPGAGGLRQLGQGRRRLHPQGGHVPLDRGALRVSVMRCCHALFGCKRMCTCMHRRCRDVATLCMPESRCCLTNSARSHASSIATYTLPSIKLCPSMRR